MLPYQLSVIGCLLSPPTLPDRLCCGENLSFLVELIFEVEVDVDVEVAKGLYDVVGMDAVGIQGSRACIEQITSVQTRYGSTILKY